MLMKSVVGVIGIVAAFGLLSVSCRKSPQAREAGFLDSGKAHMQDKQYGRAILDFKNAAQAIPKDAEPYYQMALPTWPMETSSRRMRVSARRRT